jgi:hypothetical protein
MAITTALCKPENVIAVGSPLNGGLMEKIPPQVLRVPRDGSLSSQLHPSLIRVTPPHGFYGPGGDA